MQRLFALMLLAVSCFCTPAEVFAGEDPVTLAIGQPAPDFSLPGVDGKEWKLADFKAAKVLVVIFTCNHCPTAQAYEDRIIQLTADYKNKGVAVMAISPNDPAAISLSELDYTDLGDSFEEMKIRAAKKKFNFPYLYDGASQLVARAYGPVATPHAFVFDTDRRLRFQGRIDNMEKPTKTPTVKDTRNAIDALLAGQPVAVPVTKVFGCSIKWASKENWIEKARAEWAAEPVSLSLVSEQGIRDLLKNDSKKLRLINVWATWCGPCVQEFPEFIAMKRMYKSRSFEFISISADDPANRERVLEFLTEKQSSSANYLFQSDDKYALIEAIDPKWQGALPYTILVEPGGKIVYAKQGPIDPAAMKTLIVEHPLIGRYF